MSSGIWFAVAAYTMWGFFPIFWHLLQGISPLIIMSHRILWSAVMVLIVLTLTRQLPQLFSAIQDRKKVFVYFVSGALIATNWLIYVFAIQNGYVMESSLGYFINPILNIFVGMFFFKERLRKLQWLAVFFASLGVCYMTFKMGRFPWIAISLAVTFSFYGVMRKLAPLPTILGSSLETILLVPLSLVLLAMQSGADHASSIQWPHWIYLILGGTVTILPLLCFSEAAKKLPFSTVGFIQYFAPTLQFLCSIIFFAEPFLRTQKITFFLILVAIVLFVIDLMRVRDRQKSVNADKPIVGSAFT